MEATKYTPDVESDIELSNLELHIEERDKLRDYYRQVYSKKKLSGETKIKSLPTLKPVTRKYGLDLAQPRFYRGSHSAQELVGRPHGSLSNEKLVSAPSFVRELQANPVVIWEPIGMRS